jgi:hypothetical protein
LFLADATEQTQAWSDTQSAQSVGDPRKPRDIGRSGAVDPRHFVMLNDDRKRRHAKDAFKAIFTTATLRRPASCEHTSQGVADINWPKLHNRGSRPLGNPTGLFLISLSAAKATPKATALKGRPCASLVQETSRTLPCAF